MKKGLTEIIFVLDKSGSMSNFTEDTIGGFNSFIDDQRGKEGEANISLFLFNQEYKNVFKRVPINMVSHIGKETYSPSGTTALLDAVGFAIDEMGRVYASLNENERPENVIFCITTDGLENSSKEFNKKNIADKIKHQENNYGWNFVFFGANIDSFAEAGSIGVSSQATSNYDFTSKGTTALYSAMSFMTDELRNTGKLSKSVEEYYKKAKEEE
jgi:hypothetical protein